MLRSFTFSCFSLLNNKIILRFLYSKPMFFVPEEIHRMFFANSGNFIFHLTKLLLISVY